MDPHACTYLWWNNAWESPPKHVLEVQDPKIVRIKIASKMTLDGHLDKKSHIIAHGHEVNCSPTWNMRGNYSMIYFGTKIVIFYIILQKWKGYGRTIQPLMISTITCSSTKFLVGIKKPKQNIIHEFTWYPIFLPIDLIV